MRAGIGGRGRLAVAGAVAVVAMTWVGVAWLRDAGTTRSVTRTTPASSSRASATVTRRDLITTVEVTGTFGYGPQRTVRGSGAGTITELPEPGMVIGFDEPIFGVDGTDGPVLLSGDLPMWRPLRPGVTEGKDTQQLETNLVYWGYAPDDLSVDEDYTTSTARAVKAWQAAHGLEETGRLEPGDVWYSTQPVRVATVTASPGDPAAGEILTVTGTERLIRVDLETTYARYAQVGDRVGLELADGTTSTGTITNLADTATVIEGRPGDAATTTIAVEISPEAELDALDGTPVTVSFTSDAVTDALAVPVEAIVATADGRFAVEVVNQDATTNLVEVTLGRFADGWVQVTGAITEGDEVVSA